MARLRFPLLVLGLLLAGGLASGAPSATEAPASHPGSRPHPPELRARLEATRARRGAVAPRTRHLMPDGSPKYTNRLVVESSPYLQQHAHNPVDWFPWGDEAFETARQRGVPVLLSIGYSTCHWCHVMEEESFEDVEIATVLNERYVAVKVDREERPDVDSVYMAAVQALTGGGGWPMTLWLTPDRRPFYGGTYFPPRDGDRGAGAGFLTMLVELRAAYDGQPDKVGEAAARVAAVVAERLAAATSGELPGPEVLDRALAHYAGRFDDANGGLQGAPKFPSSLPVRWLLRESLRTGEPRAREMALLTLERMAAGGMYDQLGGGFHRYSTDAGWLVPHFEKMLYDNALLALAYLDGYQASGRDDFRRVAEETLAYLAREMTSPEGAFYAATDADSAAPGGEREEGRYFTWTPAEVATVLGPGAGRTFADAYGVTAAGSLEGRSVLHLPGTGGAARPAELEKARAALLAARGGRPAPLRDEKIVAAWNGLAISAFARAARVLGDERHAAVAERAMRAVQAALREDGRVLRSARDGVASGRGYLDDVAFLEAAALELFQATGRPSWLDEALALDAILAAHHEDPAGGFFLTPDDGEKLLAREKPAYDGAEPSGNSAAVMNLLVLHELTGEDAYRKRAERALAAFGATLEESPAALSEMLLALDFRLGKPREIVIVAPRARAEAEPLLAALRGTLLRPHVLVVAVEGRDLEEQARRTPLLEGKRAIKGKPTAYVCQQGICKLPVTEPEALRKQLTAPR